MNYLCWGDADADSYEPIMGDADELRIGKKVGAPKLIGKTAQKSFERIWDLLMDGDDESRIIGVHGTAGVGKTAIMMNVYNQLLETHQNQNQFDEVIWFSTGRWNRVFPTLNEVREKLEELKKRKRRFVVFADCLYFALLRPDVIMPDKGSGCKLMFTTRSLEICNEMCRENCIVKVEVLSEGEALELFFDQVQVKKKAILTPRMIDTAKQIVKECGGLPLVIVLVGAEFGIQKNESRWLRLLLKMRNHGITDIVGLGVFDILTMDDLLTFEGFEVLLTLCALYPKGSKIPIKELVQYSHFAELGYEFEEKLTFLKNNNHLESVEVDFDESHEWGEGVKIPLLYREYAIKNSRKKGSWGLSKCGIMFEDLTWEKYRVMMASFMCNSIRTLTASPKSPKLSILFLNKNPNLCSISHNFFAHVTGLRILDLRDNHKLETLPDSVSELVNLRALRLSRCWSLKWVPSLAHLLPMKMLELDETAIEELPHGIEMLVELKVLKLYSLRLREPITSDYLSMLRSIPHLELHV